MTAWTFRAKLWWLPLTGRCVKPQLLASSICVCHNGEHVPAAVLAPVSIWFIVIMLKPATYTSKKQSLICLWWLMIPHKIFSCDQAALQMVFASVRLSVCPSVCLSHLFDYVPIIVSSRNFQELLPMTKVRSKQKVKVRGQRSRSQRSQPNLTVSGL